MREATRRDLPKGKEAQCPICWRMFTSDSACELHKPYRRPITPECKSPELVGELSEKSWPMKWVERRGFKVWTVDKPSRFV